MYKKKPKMLFKVTYHPENMEGFGAKCISEPQSAHFTNETASTCIDGMSSNLSSLLLTVRNSYKSSPFDFESEDTFMISENEKANAKISVQNRLNQFRL